MFSRNDLELSLTLPLYIVLCYTGYDRVLNNLVVITEALESSPSSLDKLTLLYKQHKWLHIKEKPEESQLVILALERIKQDPSQFDLFMKMLCSIKGMDLIVTKLTGGGLCCGTKISSYGHF